MMEKFRAAVGQFARDEDGAAMAEYGILLAVIAIVAIAGAQLIGTNLQTVFNNIANTLSGTTAAPDGG